MNNILDLMPGFVSGAHRLHNLLAGVAFMLTVAGLMLLANQAFRERSVHTIKGTLVRLIVVVVLLGSIENGANLLIGAVVDITIQAGLASGNEGGVFNAYRQAFQTKFGSDGAAYSGANFQTGGTSNGNSQGTTATFNIPESGVRLTRYGYAGDPNGDSNSKAGSGAFPFDTAPGSLVPMKSAALSPDVAQQYNIVPGQSFTATLSNGQQMNLVYADKTDDALTGRVDIYDPNGQLTNDGAAVTAIQGGPIVANNAPAGGWISRIADSVTSGLMVPFVYLLSLFSLAIMWIMTGFQHVLLITEFAISPIFIGMLMIPRLISTATHFILSMVSVILWPLGWAIADLLTRSLIGLAVNPTNNMDITKGGPILLLGFWVVLAVWVILSSFAAPFMITRALVAGSSGIVALIGATLGTTAARTATTVTRVVGGPVAAVVRNGGRS